MGRAIGWVEGQTSRILVSGELQDLQTGCEFGAVGSDEL